MAVVQSSIVSTVSFGLLTTLHLLISSTAATLLGQSPHLDPLTPPAQPAYSLLLASDVVFNPTYILDTLAW